MFKIFHFYKDELNLYGDTGNILYLQYFLHKFNIDSKVIEINRNTPLIEECDFIFAGGGPDLLQNSIFNDFLLKKDFLEKHIKSGKPSLFVCGSFQLLGNYYQTSKGDKIPGLSIFDFFTYSPTNQKRRIVGNIKAQTNFESKIFPNTVVGFENHNGRTLLGKLKPLSRVPNILMGNNDSDFSEGLLYKKTIGTYLHGPLLVKNPHILFYLLEDYLPKNLNFDARTFASEFVSFKNAIQKIR